MIRALTLIVALATSARTDAVLCSSFDDEASCDGCTFEGECVWDSAREACKAVADSENCGAIGLLDACEDSSSWYMKKENKNCKWVSKNDKRCKKTAKVKAAEACPTACAEARRLDACTDSSSWDLSQFCVDSASWEYDDGKGCAWVAEKAAEGDDKCDKKDAAGVKAKHACPVACDECPDLGNGACLDYRVVVHAETGAGESAGAAARSTTREALISCALSGALAANVAAALAHYNATSIFEVRGDATAAALAASNLTSDSADVVFDDQATCADSESYDPYCELDSCEDAYVSDPETVREVSKWEPMGQGQMHGAKAYERYGGAVALSSNGATLVAGGPSESRSGATTTGVVRIYSYGLGCCSKRKRWRETLNASDVAAFVDDDGDEVLFVAEDKLGAAVAVSRDGKIVAVSAPGYDGNAGLVLVLRWRQRDRAWVQTGNVLVGDASAANAEFGGAIDLNDDGDVLVVGARGDDAPGAVAAGSVRAYKAQHGGWFPLGYPVYGDGTDDGLGWDVALSADGTTFVTSGPNANVYINGSLNQNAGIVRVFQLAPNRYVGGWRQRGDDLYVEEAGTGQFAEAASAEFGYSVSISGDSNRIAIGSPGLKDDNGKVRVYEWRNPKGNKWNWKRLGLDIRGACSGKGVYGDECVHQRMGEAVKLSRSGINLLVGSPAANAEVNCTHPAPFAGCFGCDRCDPEHDDYDGTYGETNVGLVRAYRYNATLGGDGEPLGWVTNGIAMFGHNKSGHFGSHIDMTDNANVAVVGSPHAMFPGVGISAGSISVFRDKHSCYDAERNWVCDQNCDTSC